MDDVLPVLLEGAQAFLQCPQIDSASVARGGTRTRVSWAKTVREAGPMLIPGCDEFALAGDMSMQSAMSRSAWAKSSWWVPSLPRRFGGCIGVLHFEPVGRAA